MVAVEKMNECLLSRCKALTTTTTTTATTWEGEDYDFCRISKQNERFDWLRMGLIFEKAGQFVEH